MNTNKRIAVVLFQLGGPDSLQSVQPFLFNLFSDPDIIDFPGAFLARKFLAKFIAKKRAPIAASHYSEIGGKSPILELTASQGRALGIELAKHCKPKIFLAMRYWHPLTQAVINEMRKEEFSQVILLPLYPHYSKTTTGSSMNEWNKQCKLLMYHPENQEIIESYYNHPLYIQAIVERINSIYSKFSHLNPEDVDIVFSAHGVPVSIIKSGDPYQKHIQETVRLVVEKGKWKSPHLLCYQSKVGPAEWLKPSIDATLNELASKGRKHLLVVPIAFVTEHIETLHEINMEYREVAEHLGIEQYEMMPALNDSPTFIQCLKDLVLSKLTA